MSASVINVRNMLLWSPSLKYIPGEPFPYKQKRCFSPIHWIFGEIPLAVSKRIHLSTGSILTQP
jgi:hypothetical protein